MIKTVADLLDNIKDEEKKKIDALGINHRTTIGNTYEGLTSSILNKAIFEDLNLKIVSNSFIKDRDGKRSGEMDIMLIEGEGDPIPYTKDQYDVKYNQVIVVIQVKKKLNKSQISDSYENLSKVIDHADLNQFNSFSKEIFRDSYKGICREDILEKGKERKTFKSSTIEMIYHILKTESTLPPRIVFGYEGYKSEHGLREGFVKFLEEHKSELGEIRYGFGPLNFPSLIINGEYTLVKGNGMPYIGGVKGGQWMLYLSSSEAPILKLLEVIWTQLSYRYKLPYEIFGNDLELEGLNLFLKANMVNVGGARGWNYEYVPLSKKTLESSKGTIDWEPVKLSDQQHHIIALLCKYNSLNLQQIEQHITSIDGIKDTKSFIADLLRTGLVYQEKFEIRLLTDHCQAAFVPGYGFCAAENKSGKLSRWIDNYMKNYVGKNKNKP